MLARLTAQIAEVGLGEREEEDRSRAVRPCRVLLLTGFVTFLVCCLYALKIACDFFLSVLENETLLERIARSCRCNDSDPQS